MGWWQHMSNQIRVFHLIKSLGRGGAETLLVETLRSADRTRYDYRYGYLVPWKHALVGDLQAQGAEVTCLAGGGTASLALAAPRIARQLRTWGADILHCHLPVAGTLGRLAGRLAGVPVVYTEHNRMENYRTLTRRAALATWGLQQRVVAVSAAVAASIGRHAGDNVPVTVVRNGVDISHFQRSAESTSVRAMLGLPTSAPVIGTVAVFRQAKRLDLWLEAAAAIKRELPDACFVLVGDGPLREQVEQDIRRHGLSGAVSLPGLLTDVRRYLDTFDLFMMSSDVEGLPVAVLEAMAMECPVLSTAVGGVPEVIRDGETGLLVERGDVRALASAAIAVLRDAGTRRAMARRAREHVVSEHSIERMTRDLEMLYADVITRAHRA
jgi:L-malate glycosyltransferase